MNDKHASKDLPPDEEKNKPIEQEDKVPPEKPPSVLTDTDEIDQDLMAEIDLEEKESHIIDTLTGEKIVIKHNKAPNFYHEEHLKINVADIYGYIEKLPTPGLLNKLTPYLHKKISDKPHYIEIICIDYSITENSASELLENVETNLYGTPVTYKELISANCLIVKELDSGFAILSSNHLDKVERKILVFIDKGVANSALEALRTFPPFIETPFYTSAKVITLDEIDTDTLHDEEFIHFDSHNALLHNFTKK